MARVKANYPDWVLKYKKKGTYINFVPPDKYYLYAAHSVRDKDSGKIIRVSDGYIGRITEKDGLILSKKKRPPEDHTIHLLEYGFSSVIRSCTKQIQAGLEKTYSKNGTIIYVLSVLQYIYGFHDETLLEHSYLSRAYPDIRYPDSFSRSMNSAIERGCRMITEVMNHTFHEDLDTIRAYSSSVSVILTNNTCSLPVIPETYASLFKKYHISLEDEFNAKNR